MQNQVLIIQPRPTKAASDVYKAGYNLSGVLDALMTAICLYFDYKLFMDDEIKVQILMGSVIVLWQIIILWLPIGFYLMSRFSSVTSSQQSAKLVRDYRIAYQVKLYGGIVYQAVMYMAIREFPNIFCVSFFFGYGSSDICQFLI